MTTKHFIIATAGHVDHGKSALVEALTGTDPDRLPEEKARQITIELGFAELNLTAPNGDKIHAGIVDVPGHEDFVRNMIAGVGSIDLALLAVAADDGWMPQTEEHLQILIYLGVQRAVIALTKSDLGDVGKVEKEIRNQLRDTTFARAPVVPTSVRTAEGIENLRGALAAELASIQPQRDVGKPRLFVDRAFTLRGIGTVVTGTLTGGRVHRGQSMVVQPQNLQTRIRSIQSHGVEIECAYPGMRTALNLPDLAIDQVKRGDVIIDGDLGGTSSTLIAQLEKSPRPRVKEPAARPLKTGSTVYLHHGTSRVAARVIFFERNRLEPGKKAIAHVKLGSPIFAFIGDRFVIRDASEQHTIAGGVVLDPDGVILRDAAQRKSLSRRAAAPDDVDSCVRSEVALRGFVRNKTLLRKSRFSPSEVAAALLRLEGRKEIVARGKIAADPKFWQALRSQVIGFIDDAHKRNPERSGLDLNQLRAALRDQPEDIFEALIADLCATGFVRERSAIARTSHAAALPARLQSLEAQIRGELSKTPFNPPPRKQIDSDRDAHQALRFLIESGTVLEIGTDVVLLRENFEQMKNAIANFISANGPTTVSELRERLQSSRRIMVPLLEKLDREGFTRRMGDRRVLAHPSMTTASGALD